MINKSDVELTVKVVGALIAIFGVWAFFDDRAIVREEAASQRSLSYVEKFESESLISERNFIFEFWIGKENIIAAIAQENGISNREYDNLVRVSYEAYDKKSDLTESLIKMDNFYAQVNFCVSYELCNENLIMDYFCPRVGAFHGTYAPFFQYIGRQYEFQNLGHSTADFSQSCTS